MLSERHCPWTQVDSRPQEEDREERGHFNFNSRGSRLTPANCCAEPAEGGAGGGLRVTARGRRVQVAAMEGGVRFKLQTEAVLAEHAGTVSGTPGPRAVAPGTGHHNPTPLL